MMLGIVAIVWRECQIVRQVVVVEYNERCAGWPTVWLECVLNNCVEAVESAANIFITPDCGLIVPTHWLGAGQPLAAKFGLTINDISFFLSSVCHWVIGLLRLREVFFSFGLWETLLSIVDSTGYGLMRQWTINFIFGAINRLALLFWLHVL